MKLHQESRKYKLFYKTHSYPSPPKRTSKDIANAFKMESRWITYKRFGNSSNNFAHRLKKTGHMWNSLMLCNEKIRPLPERTELRNQDQNQLRKKSPIYELLRDH